MTDTSILFIGVVFALAGFVKGVIGLGLPTIAMGLLAIVMPPVQAAAILLVPSFATNVWQMMAGPAFAKVLRRLWPMMGGVCLGTWAGLGLMTGSAARYGTMFLGFALAIYAISGLASVRIPPPRKREKAVSLIVGAVTGLITAATGVFVIPAVPYLQAIGFEKEELVQALGLSFTVSTLALAVNITAAGAFGSDTAFDTILALAIACVGMWGGQSLRRRMSPATFRRWFFIGLLILSVYLVVRSLA